MRITQCRNATQIIEYAGKKFLIDPVFAEAETYPPFPSLTRKEARNPLCPLPLPLSRLTAVDAVLLTHLHIDHFDEEAMALLPRHLTVFVQNETDREALHAQKFENVEILSDTTTFHGIRLYKTRGQHGADEQLAQRMGPVCGVVLQSEQEQTLYIAGDTVWCGEVADAIALYRPTVIILNAGGNNLLGTPLIMGTEDVRQVHLAAPDAQLVATHMEAYNHWAVSRAELREFAVQHRFDHRLLIPADGETVSVA